jgi:branched-subunit amino acid transport protein AzlD
MSDIKLGYLAGAVAAMVAATLLTRALPFIFFARRDPPPVFAFLERYLPPLVMAILVFASLKDVPVATAPYGLPAFAGTAAAALLHLWKRNALLSIVGATALYMALVRLL